MTIRTSRILSLMLPLAAVWLVASPAAAQAIYVQFEPEVPGDAVAEGHEDWIAAFALSHAVDVPVSTGGGGGHQTGNPDFSEGISFLKGTDPATPELHVKAAAGQHFSRVNIDVCRAPMGQLECYYQIELQDVVVTNISMAGSTCVDPDDCTPNETESVTLLFEQIRWVYTPWSGGKKGAPVDRCWNVVQNKAC